MDFLYFRHLVDKVGVDNYQCDSFEKEEDEQCGSENCPMCEDEYGTYCNIPTECGQEW